MRIRLIQITTRRSGAQARREEMRDDDVLTVGRGTDNDVSLPGLSVSLHHASFRLLAGGIRVEGVEGNVVVVNGRVSSGQDVAPGDVIRLGSFDLRLLEPAGDEQLALEIEEVERAGDALEALHRHTRLGVEGGWLSQRRLTWLGIIATPLLFFALPWRAAHWSEPVHGQPETRLDRAAVAAVQTWSTGPIAPGHRRFAQECGRCHVVGFEQVRDQECLACHARIEAHADPDRSPHPLTDITCTECHTEHAGVHGLSEREPSSCVPCHAQLASLEPPAKLAVATDFGTDHPQFRLTLVAKDGQRERVTWSPKLEESTGLIYSHLRHVGQAVENRATGRSEYMRCDSCHVTEPGGRSFEPVQFETACQSCHPMGFDEDFPETQAFHGDPVLTRERLLDFYSAVALGGRVPPGRGPAVLRGAPGKTLGPSERRAALDWAKAQAKLASEFLMTNEERCGECHPILKHAARDGGDAVAPVDVPHRWLAHTQFSHRTHMPSACSACHASITVFDPDASPDVPRPSWAAATSEPYGLLTPDELARLHPGETPSDSASDVSIPGLEDCRSCHAGPSAPLGRIASECVLCHDFHRQEQGPMSGTSVAGHYR
jgi:hypothetical protein